ncbi:hypothetical protein AB205_0157700 [Aquarana catesbeiana]|uniref:Midnolin n=1 Tax=Aquarana catesbeiana TaxID=8400 RepID=A0A2G9QFA0_AQUCT|nr:hypothetical protein AB205_0157700 [Aquarana catesbeiana]
MMFVQLQLAPQQAGGSHLQHRHLFTRGTEHSSAPHFRTLHTSATPAFSRLAGCAQGSSQPSVSTPATSTHCNASHTSSLTNSIYHSRGEGVTVSPCTEVQRSRNGQSSEGSSPAPSGRPRKPGAIIESFVNHAPGVFSGTFSGTLHPHCQDSTGRPRRDIGTILQILNDLLSATRHYQGIPSSLAALRCHSQCASETKTTKATSPPSTSSAPQQTSHHAEHSKPQARQYKPIGK